MHFGSQREASEALLLKMQFRTKDRRKMKPKRLNRDTKRTFWVVWLFFLSCCFELEGTLFFPSLPLESNNQKKTTSPQFVWQLLRAISLSRKNYKLIFACSYMELQYLVTSYRCREQGSPFLWSHFAYPGHWQWLHCTSLHHIQRLGFGPGLLDLETWTRW